MFLEILTFVIDMFILVLSFVFTIQLQPGVYLWHLFAFTIVFGFIIQYIWNTVIDKEGGK